ncbi:Maf family protein [Actibacterium pelagium]|uniref:Nucleoside triphosphate pyrophosphatase n=1 Tax=Actibacterium pelagium TaxID=2029103 RepID=A0A917EM30_9RHOB|nr:Maf family nucleotide pyrophosphatase [Actibacterium pelagium]GGE55373.1 Maf-like protein [Actibacterium pelagium]
MAASLIIASGSDIRQQLLRNAGVEFAVQPARVDEEAIKQSLLAEGATPHDIADALAEFKARRIAEKNPGALVLGCDQILELKGEMLSKPSSPDQARDQLKRMRGARHKLLSAAVLYEDGKPVWRHVGQVRLTMRPFSDSYLESYIERNWDSIQHAVGCYKLEEEGVRLFSQIEGDYFTVLGLPLLPFLNYLTLRGDLPA